MDDVTLTVTVPAQDAQRIVAALSGLRGYAPENPADGVAFVKNEVFAWLAKQTISWEAQQAAQAVYANPGDPLAGAVVQSGGGQ